MQNRQTGRSMVEMLGILVIVAVATMGAVALWGQMRTKMRITQMQNELSVISKDVEKLYSWTRDYSLLNMTQLCDAGIFPRGCNEAETMGINAFGGSYTLDGGTSGSPYVEDGIPYFKLTAAGLPNEDVCEEIVGTYQGTYLSYECDGTQLEMDF